MGRGRAKATQVKVARQLKYNSGGTDLERLRAELGVVDADGVPPSVAADRLAERRMADVGRLRGIWLGTMGSA